MIGYWAILPCVRSRQGTNRGNEHLLSLGRPWEPASQPAKQHKITWDSSLRSWDSLHFGRSFVCVNTYWRNWFWFAQSQFQWKKKQRVFQSFFFYHKTDKYKTKTYFNYLLSCAQILTMCIDLQAIYIQVKQHRISREKTWNWSRFPKDPKRYWLTSRWRWHL